MIVTIFAPLSYIDYCKGRDTKFVFSNTTSVEVCVEEVKKLSYKGLITQVAVEK